MRTRVFEVLCTVAALATAIAWAASSHAKPGQAGGPLLQACGNAQTCQTGCTTPKPLHHECCCCWNTAHTALECVWKTPNTCWNNTNCAEPGGG